MRRKHILAVLTISMIASVIPLAGVAGATTVGDTEGCTPGFWKNHTDWVALTGENITTSSTWASVGVSLPAPYNTYTLYQSLSLPGGPGVDGAIRNLLRAAAAAWLNAATEIEYPYQRFTPNGIEASVEAAVAGANRATILALASKYDSANNLGCPLS